MRVYSNQIVPHLNRRLDPIYLIIGEEPVQQQETIQAIRQAAYVKTFTGYERYEVLTASQWPMFLEQWAASSLFAEKRMIELHLAHRAFNLSILQQLLALIQEPFDQILIITMTKIEAHIRKHEAYLALQKKAIEIFVTPPLRTHFPKIVQERLRQAGLQLDKEAFELFIAHTEGSLLAVVQTIEKLRLQNIRQPISTKADIQDTLIDHSEFSIADLLNACLEGNIPRSLHIFLRLKQKDTEPLLLLGTFTNTIRALIRCHTGDSRPVSSHSSYYTTQKDQMLISCSQRFILSELNALLLNAAQIDTILKGLTVGDGWSALQSVYLRLAGHQNEVTI